MKQFALAVGLLALLAAQAQAETVGDGAGLSASWMGTA